MGSSLSFRLHNIQHLWFFLHLTVRQICVPKSPLSDLSMVPVSGGVNAYQTNNTGPVQVFLSNFVEEGLSFSSLTAAELSQHFSDFTLAEVRFSSIRPLNLVVVHAL